MIVEQITIKNWRGYREPHTFQFKDGINLLAGRNEAGKSTLFEALTRVLFDRHNSKTEEIRAIQPIDSSLSPEAHVQLRANGRRYRAVKRFLQDPKSALYSDRRGTWELDHEGDEADAHLRERSCEAKQPHGQPHGLNTAALPRRCGTCSPMAPSLREPGAMG
ncbi:MAG: AAA family ATPase [Candidatus Eisenbacteria bacterium]|nr:AAA family ATPase [Candidatus Eisenbacteria bacterium]